VDIIRKVDLTMNENLKYEVIKKLVEKNGNKKRAAVELNCTVRHINRMIKGYKETGKKFFVHGNRGRKPAHSLDDSLKQNIVDLYRTKYQGSNITHFSELLNEFEGIKVSSTTIRSILLEKFILSPKAKRSSRKKSPSVEEDPLLLKRILYKPLYNNIFNMLLLLTLLKYTCL
jgi:transposase